MSPTALPTHTLHITSGSRNPRELFARCPTCGRHSWFRYCGEQQWSEHVAASCGVPALMRLWICDTCNTTLSEPSLRR